MRNIDLTQFKPGEIGGQDAPPFHVHCGQKLGWDWEHACNHQIEKGFGISFKQTHRVILAAFLRYRGAVGRRN